MAPSPLNLPTQPGVITLTAEEKAEGKWSRSNMQKAMEYMHRDGLLVMSGIVDTAELIQLREEMLKTSVKIISEKTSPADYNHGVMSNFLQSPPLTNAALRFPDVYQNRFVVQVAEGYLGSDLYMPFITSNVAVNNTKQRQPVHKDTGYVHPSAPHMAISNFLLSDFAPANGSTEFWLGSHNSTLPIDQQWLSYDAETPLGWIRPDHVEERRLTRPPCQVTVPFGCVLLRDVRVWHAGMPNPSDEDRIMVAVAYQSSWFPRDRPFNAPESARELLTSNPKVTPIANFLPDEEYLKICQKFAPGEPMFLRYGPFPEGWTTISDVAVEDRYIADKSVKVVH